MSKREKSVNTLEGPVTEVAAEFPERHVLIKCPGCRRVIDQAKLAENLDVCPRCGRREGEAVSEEKLRELRRKYPHMPTCHCR